MAVRVDHHPPQFFVGLFPGLGRSEPYGVLSRLLQIGDTEVEVILLRMILPRPCRRRVALDTLEIEGHPQGRRLGDPYSG